MNPWKLVFLFVWCAVLRCAASIALLPYADGYYLNLAAQVFQYVMLLVLCCVVFKFDRLRIHSIFGKLRPNDLWAGAALAVVFAALTWGSATSTTYSLGHSEMPLALFSKPFQERFDTGAALFPLHLTVHFLVNVLMVPVVEEFFFLGLLFPALAQRRTLVWSAVLCSTIFTFVHLGDFFNLNAFALSFVLLVVYAKGGSLYTCIAAHAGYNLLTFLAPYSVGAAALPQAATWMPAALVLLWLWYRQRDYLRSWWLRPEYRIAQNPEADR